MSESSSISPSESLLVLRACVSRLAHGPWKFIRLRGVDSEMDHIDVDDVDLLGSRESVDALLDAAYQWVLAGECHLRVTSGNRRKVGLQLISSDGRHVLHLDLWIELRQIDDRKRCLTYQCCSGRVMNPSDSIQRLPIDLEASIFVHHLVSKRKKVSDPKQIARLEAYADACEAEGRQELSRALRQAATSADVGRDAEALTLRLLEGAFEIPRPSALKFQFLRIRDATAAAWLQAPRKVRMLGVMGCDGCGKTTLCKQLTKSNEGIYKIYTGKHLYRKWILYKLLVIFVRPLLFQGREKFDDTFAPLAYMLACIRLRVKLLCHRKGITLIDRSIMDFLMTGRKTDAPRFSSFIWLAAVFGIRLQHIHLTVPYEILKERKLEMTEKGHAFYDQAMFRHFSRRAPTDHVVFANRQSAAEALAALERIIDRLRA